MSNPNTVTDFEKLFDRPANYNSLSEERQWEIDKGLGILDLWLDPDLITEEMYARYHAYFGESPE